MALGVAAAAMAVIGMGGVAVGYLLALHGETVPAFVGMVVGQVLTGLTLMGRWVLSYQARETTLEVEDVPKA